MSEQYNRIRKSPACCICKLPKDHGLVICWQCNRTLKSKHDGAWGKSAELILDRVEFMLECAGVEPCS